MPRIRPIPPRARAGRFRPDPEPLEGRALPATLLVNPAVPADYPTISAAVAAAAAGDTIKVSPGVYNETVVVDKPLTLLGPGAGVPGAARAGSPAANEAVVQGLVSNPVSLVQQPSFDIKASGVWVDGFTVEGQGNTNSATAGIALEPGVSGSVIVDDVVEGCGVGLMLANSDPKNLTYVIDNDFHDNNSSSSVGNHAQPAGTAIANDTRPSAGDLNGVMIHHNTFTNNRAGSVVLNASSPGSVSYVFVQNNVATNGIVTAFDVHTLWVLNNVVDASAARNAGVLLSGGDDGVAVLGNTITNPGGSAPARDAIDVSQGPGPDPIAALNTQIYIESNVIRNCQRGVWVSPGAMWSSAIVSNLITGCSQNGIQIDLANLNDWVVNNVLLNNGSTPATFDAVDASTGQGTAGTANFWINNAGRTSKPAGLLRFVIP